MGTISFKFGIATLLFALGYLLPTAQTRKCYSCTYAPGYDEACINQPSDIAGSVKDCGEDQCYVERQIQLGKLFSVGRGCDVGNTRKNSEKTNGDKVVVCTSDLCNDHDFTYTPSSTTIKPTISGPTVPPIKGFQCYQCNLNNPDCLDRPQLTREVFCPNNWHCFILRQTYTESRELKDLTRGCALKQHKNGCTEDSSHINCYTYCQGKFCNSGDGANPPVDPTDDPVNLQPKSTQPLTILIILSVVIVTASTV